MWPNLQFPAGLVRSTKEILNGNLIFCAAVKETQHSDIFYTVLFFFYLRLSLFTSFVKKAVLCISSLTTTPVLQKVQSPSLHY